MWDLGWEARKSVLIKGKKKEKSIEEDHQLSKE